MAKRQYRVTVAVDGDNIELGRPRGDSRRIKFERLTAFVCAIASVSRADIRLMYYGTTLAGSRARRQLRQLRKLGWEVYTQKVATYPQFGRRRGTFQLFHGMSDQKIQNGIRNALPTTSRALIVVTGDHGFDRVLVEAKTLGRHTVVVAWRRSCAKRLIEVADRTVFLDDYHERLARAVTTPAA